MTSYEIMREKISTVYPGLKWKARVRKMSTQQVLAVYFRMHKDGWL